MKILHLNNIVEQKRWKVGNKITSYFTGKIKEGKLEKIMEQWWQTYNNVEGDVITNTDTSSIINNTTQKMDNVATMNESGMNKSVNETTSTTNNVVNNNVQQNDNSQNTNKTEYGSSSIGSQNKSGFVDFY